jgi:hypothetical protein
MSTQGDGTVCRARHGGGGDARSVRHVAPGCPPRHSVLDRGKVRHTDHVPYRKSHTSRCVTFTVGPHNVVTAQLDHPKSLCGTPCGLAQKLLPHRRFPCPTVARTTGHGRGASSPGLAAYPYRLRDGGCPGQVSQDPDRPLRLRHSALGGRPPISRLSPTWRPSTPRTIRDAGWEATHSDRPAVHGLYRIVIVSRETERPRGCTLRDSITWGRST